MKTRAPGKMVGICAWEKDAEDGTASKDEMGKAQNQVYGCLYIGPFNGTLSGMKYPTRTGLEINISRQWTIGPPVLNIWWSCQISGGPDVANRQSLFVKSNTADIIYLFLLQSI